MSRIANNPVSIPAGVEVTLNDTSLSVKGSKGTMALDVHHLVSISQDEGELKFVATQRSKVSGALAGTFRALVANMVTGVTTGFTRELQLIGVGYRAQSQGRVLNLSLGFSHPVEYQIPEGIEIDTPTQTQVLVRGMDKQKVGQVSAEIRAYRPPEPYKGKGVRYSDEIVKRKEAKKK
ncbi:50S ribosomal protein L6 [Pseudomonadales bacterium]|jgi:large subunit ribosomal protein L6|nr:50S ribosomal protein L6 [Pseudomonadales bacterium]MDA9063972.1 50S ribosomal protein L6 [Pseudomonadales bacterium]MDA9285833.1 50S ribosomal protein L6 [Pseudomonadales bacterium]MDA9366525.1 50S ribosomal protein L6 [Pseudomonadales bacterium]MDB4068528.1 50S ribosomal protein L6 [Pseudomonadales bacterium]